MLAFFQSVFPSPSPRDFAETTCLALALGNSTVFAPRTRGEAEAPRLGILPRPCYIEP